MVMPAVRAVGANQTFANQPVARAAATVAGDLMLAFLDVDNSTTAPTTAPAGWANPYSQLTLRPRFHLYWKIATSTEPADYTWLWPAGDDNSFAGNIISVEAGTFDAANPIALIVANTNASNTSASVHTHPGLTTTLPDALAVWMFSTAVSTSTPPVGVYDTYDAGVTERVDNPTDAWVTMAVATEPRPTAGATGTRSATFRIAGTATARTQWRTLGFVVQGSSGGLQVARSLSDAAAITDSHSRVLAATRTLTDSAAISDSATWALSSGPQLVARTLTDSAAITDSASWSMQLGPQQITRQLSDSAAIRDSASWVLSEPNPKRTLVDNAAITDSASWVMSEPRLGDFQFLLLGDRIPRMIFGLDSSVVVHPDGFDPAYGDLRTQDQNAPQGDWRRFGADKRTPGVWNWEAWTDAQSPAAALDLVDAMAEAWDAEYTRETPGEVLALQYKIPGRPVRRLYGRPRNFQAPGGPLIQNGRLDMSFELHRVEDVTYDDDEQAVPIYLGKPGTVAPSPWRFPLRFPTSTRTNTEPRIEQVQIGGRLRTWVTLGIKGPIVNPWVQIGTRRWALQGQVPGGRTVYLSGLPWAQTVYMDDGTFRPDMLDARSRLGHLRFEPGTYPATFGGYDQTGTARAEVRWRNAYRGW